MSEHGHVHASGPVPAHRPVPGHGPVPARTRSLTRTRARARSAVALVALLTLAALPEAAAALTQPAQNRSPAEWQQLARSIFEELIGINTTDSRGNNTEAAEAMRRRLLAAGFDEADVQVIEPAPRKGNLVARLRGRDPALKPILLLAHIDVVEANPEDWTLPPFELIERDSTFYGRGTADDKDEAALYVTNLIRMKTENFVPDRDIIVALTADEEGGPTNGVEWLLENRRDLIDAAYALNEGGGGILDEQGRHVSNTVQAAEKKFQNYTLEVTNPGGHSSRPRPDNAIYELAQALVRIGAHHFPVRLNEVTRAHLEASLDIVEPEVAAAMRRVLQNEQDAEAIAVLAKDARLNSMLRTTCVATMLEGGHATNALPQRARANVNCRILPDADPDSIQAMLQRIAAVPTLSITMEGRARNSPPSPLTPELLAHIERITREMWPDVPVVPTMSTGATDGLYLRNAGIPVYGVSGLFYGETYSHGMNERIPVRSFYEGQEFLYRLVKALSARPVS
ncbi:MAG: M20/M25/M40 family metallo-hydrolase [Gemmatimonadetes bacterium]|nr:M20/M25/M40 family metallo-hydrolase [Gemmatimonadota bacterium]